MKRKWEWLHQHIDDDSDMHTDGNFVDLFAAHHNYGGVVVHRGRAYTITATCVVWAANEEFGGEAPMTGYGGTQSNPRRRQ